ncbi:MAG: hypothetical protein ACRYF3_14715, partial [Janthinobacterium lividum]
QVAFTPPTGQQLDNRGGAATRLVVSASPPGLIVTGAGDEAGLHRDLVLGDSAPDEGDRVIHVSVRAAVCDNDADTGEVPEFAACHLHQQDWRIPVRLTAGAAPILRLHLRAV